MPLPSQPRQRTPQATGNQRLTPGTAVNPSGAPRTNPNTIAAPLGRQRVCRMCDQTLGPVHTAQLRHTRARHRHPAEPGTRPLPYFTLPSPIHSSLPQFIPPPSLVPPPFQGEVRWGVRGPTRPPTLSNTPITHPYPDCLSPHTSTLPNSGYPHTRTEVPSHAPLPTTTPPPRPPRRQPDPDQR